MSAGVYLNTTSRKGHAGQTPAWTNLRDENVNIHRSTPLTKKIDFSRNKSEVVAASTQLCNSSNPLCPADPAMICFASHDTPLPYLVEKYHRVRSSMYKGSLCSHCQLNHTFLGHRHGWSAVGSRKGQHKPFHRTLRTARCY